MVRDAQAHADEDKRRREEVEAKNTADSVAYQTERQLNEFGDRVPANEKARAEQLIAEVRQLIKSESPDVATLRQLTSDLQQITHSLGAAAYSQAAAAGAQGGRSNSSTTAGSDDVVDAEFKQSK
jgi:molecular chaperone DnaK